MDSNLIALARRQPFVMRAMDEIANRCGQQVAFAILDRTVCAVGGIPFEPDMVIALYDTPDRDPIAVIHAGDDPQRIEWLLGRE